ncbi:hypothetical protein H1R20_g6674, partial [Candolleomyces eurysporus]
MHIMSCLQDLRAHRLGPFDVINHILDGNSKAFGDYRDKFYMEDNENLDKILTAIANSHKGREKLAQWLQTPTGQKIITDIVSDEMDKVTESERLPGLAVITPDFVKNWKVEHHHQQAPFLLAIIRAAAQTDRAAKENKQKTPDTDCVALQRYHEAARLPALKPVAWVPVADWTLPVVLWILTPNHQRNPPLWSFRVLHLRSLKYEF